MSKHAAFATASAIALILSGAALGQEDASTTPGETEDAVRSLQPVVVTATRRQENLQSTGSSIAALNEDALALRSVQSVEDIADLTPGLQVSTYQGGHLHLRSRHRYACDYCGRGQLHRNLC